MRELWKVFRYFVKTGFSNGLQGYGNISLGSRLQNPNSYFSEWNFLNFWEFCESLHKSDYLVCVKDFWDILSNMSFSLYKKSGLGSELLNPARGHSYEFSRRFSGYFAKTRSWNENNYMEIED